jgi:hypothetical protein
MPIVDTLWAEGSGAKELGDHPLQQAPEPFELLVEMATIEWRIIGVDADPRAIALAHERLRSGPR